WGNEAKSAGWMEGGTGFKDRGRFPKASRGGQPPQPQGNPPMPNFAAVAPPPPNAASTAAGQSRTYQPGTLAASPGLPQHVIDAGHLLRAHGYQIQPRTNCPPPVLGPQAAVDLINRTGSTASPAVPSPDAATGDQMRAWVRALRLGPAAAGIAGGMTTAPNAGSAAPDQLNTDAFDATQPFG